MSKGKPQFVTVQARRIHYAFLNKQWMAEQKPLLVFLHEGLGSIRQWKDFPSLLSEQVHCPALLYDRYGYGLSEELHEPRYVRFLHDEAIKSLPDLFGQLQIVTYPKIIIGHSDGGTIALIHAGTHPESLLGVIVEAPHVLVEEATLGGILEVRHDFEHGKLRELLRKYHHEKTEYLVTSWVENWLSGESRTWNVEEYLPMIKCPVLAIQGDMDHFGSVAQLESIERNTKTNTRVLYIAGCGHIPHQQARETVTEAMAGFITEIETINQKKTI
jgi:pimeloyl-ACP methyl ester carboxylesterase